MKLMTTALRKRFRQVGRQEHVKDPIVIAKFFTPDSNWTWYATEYDPDERLFFGLVVGFESEMGYFSLDELESVRGSLGLKIERDRHLGAALLSEVAPNFTTS
jgi:hypothetical protein